MTATNKFGAPVYLACGTTPFLEGGHSGTVAAVSYNPLGHVMRITLDDGHTYDIRDTNPDHYQFFKGQCGV